MDTVLAANFTVGRTRAINKVVIHTAESPESGIAAEAVASYFHRGGPTVGSSHIVVDADSAVRCVSDVNTAWGAAGANADGLHLELAGIAAQSADDWQDDYSQAVLRNAAPIVRAWCDTYAIPRRKLTPEELAGGYGGICGHVDVATAFPEGNDGHSDPGPNFPWVQFIALIRGDPLMALSDKQQQELFDNVKQLHNLYVAHLLFENPSVDATTLNVGSPILTTNEIVRQLGKKAGILP